MKPFNTETEFILTEYSWLRSFGVTRAECARRLHRHPESLTRLLHRAAQLGDPRSDWEPHNPERSISDSAVRHRRERARGWAA